MDNSQFSNLSFGQKSFTEEVKKYQMVQTSLLKTIFSDDIVFGRTKELKSFLGAIVSTSVAISRLANEDLLNECTMLGRAFFERNINFCCLLLCDERIFLEYWEHFIQKAYRKLDRSFQAGETCMSVKFSNKDALDVNESLRIAVEKYTTKTGKENRDFLRMKIPEKLQLIQKESGISVGYYLHYQTLFYEDGSEAMHGSFYGTIFHLGVAQPDFDASDIAAVNTHIQKMLSLLLLDIGTLCHCLILIISKFEKIQTIVDGSTRNFELSAKLLEAAIKANKDKISNND